MNDKISSIKITSSTRAAGKSLEAGETYKVPSQVSAADAKTLIQIGKAEALENKKSGKKEEGADNK